MISTQVRPADLNDHQRLSNLIFFETRSHRHLDWRSPLEWLGDKFFWAVDEGAQITAALACPEETDGIAWVRLFVHSGYWSADNAWTTLWDAARTDIARAGGTKVAAIVKHSWFQKVLELNGFENRQNIVMLEWSYQPWAAREAAGIRFRKMTEADLPHVTEVDWASFDPLWHNSQETLRRALAQSLFHRRVPELWLIPRARRLAMALEGLSGPFRPLPDPFPCPVPSVPPCSVPSCPFPLGKPPGRPVPPSVRSLPSLPSLRWQ